MTVEPSLVWPLVRDYPARRPIELRDPVGALLYTITPHEAWILLEKSAVEGVANRHGLKYLRLRVKPRRASALLRRFLCSTGRTVAEACQLTTREQIANGVVYSHIDSRTRSYAPCNRGDFLRTVSAR